MSTFQRRFRIERITGQTLEEAPWWEDMLRLWRPAGDAIHHEGHKFAASRPTEREAPQHLRLAIRNGYLNLYRGGQSLARIHFNRDGRLQAEIHNKYVYGKDDSDQRPVTLTSAGLRDRNATGLRPYGGPAELKKWIANATKRVREEKDFVDRIVARNPNLIDLEMALPAYSLGSEKRTAPRMDIVALEQVGDRWRIVFWEAKLVNDGRARSRGDDVAPNVIGQLEQYTKWLGHGGHRELVACAFQETCKLLVRFHELAKRVNPDIEELGAGIVAVALGAPPLLVDAKPRLLIDDRAGSSSFEQHGHLQKLRGLPHNIHVQMVNGVDDMVLKGPA